MLRGENNNNTKKKLKIEWNIVNKKKSIEGAICLLVDQASFLLTPGSIKNQGLSTSQPEKKSFFFLIIKIRIDDS